MFCDANHYIRNFSIQFVIEPAVMSFATLCQTSKQPQWYPSVSVNNIDSENVVVPDGTVSESKHNEHQCSRNYRKIYQKWTARKWWHFGHRTSEKCFAWSLCIVIIQIGSLIQWNYFILICYWITGGPKIYNRIALWRQIAAWSTFKIIQDYWKEQ